MIGGRLLARLGRVVLGGALATALVGCAGPGSGSSPTPGGSSVASPAGARIVAQVASYEIVANRRNRLLVALLSDDNRWLSFGSVRMSFQSLGDRSGSAAPSVSLPDASAKFLPIPGSPSGAANAQPTLTFPADGHGVYSADPVTFPQPGFWQVIAHGNLADGTQFEADAAFEVVAKPSVVSVGDVAPRTDNPVAGDPSVPAAAIDSRAAGGQPIPDPELHATSIADAIAARHPALVVFSTPVYCVSRFCGPVTDMVAELAAQYGDRADFIHVEIYRDFEAGKINQAAMDWLQPPNGDLREPWVFLIGADGRIAGSWDTMVTRGEIEPLLKALPPKK